MLHYSKSDHIIRMIVLNAESMAYYLKYSLWISWEKSSTKVTLSNDSNWNLYHAKNKKLCQLQMWSVDFF